MKNKILYLVFATTMLVAWDSCTDPHTVTYRLTEKDSPFDTIIMVENMQQYRSVYVQTYWEWDDTVIFCGAKMPAQSFTQHKMMDNYDHKDTIHITFDKYKAKKVYIYSEKTFQ